jgi:hypothetical protein
MLHLLKIEWLKIKNYRAFWIFCAFYIASIFLINYIGWSTHQRTTQEVPGSDAIMGHVYSFPKVWQTVGWMSSWLLYFPGMLMIMLMTNEFNFRTHRQNVIDGLSRNQFIAIKIVLAILLTILITLTNVLTAFYFGSISAGSFSTEGMENIGYIFLQSIAYIFFALMLAVWFRKSGLAIIIFLVYGIIFEWLITGIITFKLHWAPAGYFLPLQASDVLIPLPFGKRLFYPDTPAVPVLVATIAAYLFAYIYFARRKFLRDDL